MMQILKLLAVLVYVLGMTWAADWCYKSQVSHNICKGPDEWKDIVPTCGSKNQSPVNIETKRVVINNLTPFSFQGYQHTFHSVITNNGHTVKVNVSDEAVISNAGLVGNYKAVEVHFHWGKNGGPGSEHTIDEEQYPMEDKYNSVQEATKDPNGLAVLGFLYQESDTEDKKYGSIINALNIIKFPGNQTQLDSLSLAMLIPPLHNLTRYFRYKGSLTTPDCAEVVIWTVFENTIKLSKEQLKTFSSVWFKNGTALTETFRPVQPLNDRVIFYSGSHVASVSTALVISMLIITFYTV
ncbi:carbonic anhydrase 4b isoform 2-T2 [Clarias gariepinus]|uniref:carbonic anhydrase 4b isoform X2 n=1 Tax=Clarias gariepinus TaxID=13013 RepID=UPI00234C60C9|nr:carbonic anhydrase 4b isoform X2 [Clarias gariepinus]